MLITGHCGADDGVHADNQSLTLSVHLTCGKDFNLFLAVRRCYCCT